MMAMLLGDAVAQASANSLVFSDSRLVTAIGVTDTVVIETADAVLVARNWKKTFFDHGSLVLFSGFPNSGN